MKPELSHINNKGDAHMVNVSEKDVSPRKARARGIVLMNEKAIELISTGTAVKGDVIGVARIAGILAAKKTSELIPLCHSIPIHSIEIDFEICIERVEIVSEVTTIDRTGIEMEAMTAVSIAALTLIDMIKSVDRYASVSHIGVESKSGGRSGDWNR